MLVSGDSRRLKQVMWNVLSNAVKFTPLGGRIDLEIQPKGSYAHIRITDNGTGIRPDFLPYVFDRFRQDDTRSNEGLGGLGLGLALVRYLTEMHGGNVTAQSLGVGHGATFVIRLPLVNASVCAQSSKSLHAPTVNSHSFSNEIAETVSQTPLGPAQLIRFGGLSSS